MWRAGVGWGRGEVQRGAAGSAGAWRGGAGWGGGDGSVMSDLQRGGGAAVTGTGPGGGCAIWTPYRILL